MLDLVLFDRLKRGDHEAFNSLFRRFYPRIMAYVAAMVEQEVAEDIVQDIFACLGKSKKAICWRGISFLFVSIGLYPLY